ncbi:uncharacterized protein H6S33_008229 [Morchella sextelata]|uniref:uncharacterized protein n=1 Tax=Morchella sextelata TaxID=1174677 RepID=UPI001D057C2A|nr:uncharacterized protein H6S33_008229 [Morchella sextelata]KAH0603225.1 hypothetical protein H6S33_008229 [Morchella sextelata]
MFNNSSSISRSPLSRTILASPYLPPNGVSPHQPAPAASNTLAPSTLPHLTALPRELYPKGSTSFTEAPYSKATFNVLLHPFCTSSARISFGIEQLILRHRRIVSAESDRAAQTRSSRSLETMKSSIAQVMNLLLFSERQVQVREQRE